MSTPARSWWLWASLGALAVALVWKGSAVASAVTGGMPRGLRNRNPGNLRHFDNIKWRGELAPDSDGYAVFDSYLNGLRAAFIDLHTGFVRDRENTVRKIITEWAPASENNTAAYIAAVARKLGVTADQELSFADSAVPLMRAIVYHENGQDPLSAGLYEDALRATGKV